MASRRGGSRPTARTRGLSGRRAPCAARSISCGNRAGGWTTLGAIRPSGRSLRRRLPRRTRCIPPREPPRRGRCSRTELGEEFLDRQEALDPVALRPRWVDDQDGRRPLHAETCAVPIPVGFLFTYVDARWQEMLTDEAGHALIRIDLGIQPSAAPSGRGRAEIEQDVLPPGLRLGKDRLHIPPP